MSTTFSVDPDELFQLAQTASLLSMELHEERLAAAADGLAGVSGSRRLVESSYGDFVGNWTDGLISVSKNLTELSNAVGEAAAIYASTEREVLRAAGGGSRQLRVAPSPATGPLQVAPVPPTAPLEVAGG